MKSSFLFRFMMVFIFMIILRLLISFSQSGITLAHEIAAFVIIGLYAVGSVYMVAVTFKVLVGYFSSVDN